MAGDKFTNVYIDDTLGIGVGIEQGWPDRPGEIPFAGGGFHSPLMVENTNRNTQVVSQLWSNDDNDDGKETWVVFATTADSHRPNSRNGVIRVDAVNYSRSKDGPCTGILVNIHGVNANLNRGVHVAVQQGSNAYAYMVTNPEFGGEENPCWSVDRRGTMRSEQMTEIEARIGVIEKKIGLPSSKSSWWQFWR